MLGSSDSISLIWNVDAGLQSYTMTYFKRNGWNVASSLFGAKQLPSLEMPLRSSTTPPVMRLTAQTWWSESMGGSNECPSARKTDRSPLPCHADRPRLDQLDVRQSISHLRVLTSAPLSIVVRNLPRSPELAKNLKIFGERELRNPWLRLGSAFRVARK